MAPGEISDPAAPAAAAGSLSNARPALDSRSLEAMLGLGFDDTASNPCEHSAIDMLGSARRPDPGAAGPGEPAHRAAACEFVIPYTEKEKRKRKYECAHCRKRFLRPSSLTSHMYTHTGERPFACEFPECTRRFSVLSNLRRHHKVHTKRHRQPPGGSRIRDVPFAWSLLAGGAPAPGPAPILPGNPLLGAGHMPSLAAPLLASAFAPASQYRSTYPGMPATGGGAPACPAPLSQALVHSVIGAAPAPHAMGGLPLLPRLSRGSEPLSPVRPAVPAPGWDHPLCLADIVLASSGLTPSSSAGSAQPSSLGSAFTDSQVEAILASASASYSGDSDSGSDSARTPDSQLAALGGPLVAGAPAIATPAFLTDTSTTTKAMTGGISAPPGSAAALLGAPYAGCASAADNPVWQLLPAAWPEQQGGGARSFN